MWVSLRRGDLNFKLQRSGPGQPIGPVAFDLSVDPAESRDVLDTGRSAHWDAITALENYKARLVAAYREPHGEVLDEAERVEQLKALGYL